jgi:2-methylisocitrate lyase-like PEP mutase family enzyme
MISTALIQKANTFHALHLAPGAFVIPNPWDAGSARLLAALGFQALATSSWASAGTLGRRDGGVSRTEAIAMARAIAASVDIPVSADLENGFGDTPEYVAETIQLAGEAGLVGGSIEDATGDAANPLYDITLAAERIAAAVEVARRLPFRFVLTARAENFIRGRPDLDDVIKRLQAYEKAGADVLFAPGLRDLAAVRTVCAAVTKPVNFMNAIPHPFTVAELAEAGVKRISLAAALYRSAMTSLRDAATEVMKNGTFRFVDQSMNSADLAAMMRPNA